MGVQPSSHNFVIGIQAVAYLVLIDSYCKGVAQVEGMAWADGLVTNQSCVAP